MNKNITLPHNMGEVIFMLYNDIPKDFEMSLAKNFCAMKYVSELPPRKQKRVIDKAKKLRTQDEMRNYIIELASNLKV